ncbi:hypothetical protein GIB67_011804 [Kingdonia uniflora]|uniref:Uncharacterized protein n=1 Tax=Kingdonia uniflora TaxID=39325 RepID=A0A7J7NXI4_9MAGN|nr:hypothetical protein GIB67_011804 [Kingdonia uniflora]
MYSEFDPISFVGMPNSNSFLLKKDLEENIDLAFQLEPMMESQNEHPLVAYEDSGREEHKEDGKKEKCASFVSLEQPGKLSLEKFEVDDGNDGFRTPTSLDKRIPVKLQCPPAPKKIKSMPSRKRKSSTTFYSSRIVLDKEVELLFKPVDLGRKIKKVKGDYNI